MRRSQLALAFSPGIANLIAHCNKNLHPSPSHGIYPLYFPMLDHPLLQLMVITHLLDHTLVIARLVTSKATFYMVSQSNLNYQTLGLRPSA